MFLFCDIFDRRGQIARIWQDIPFFFVANMKIMEIQCDFRMVYDYANIKTPKFMKTQLSGQLGSAHQLHRKTIFRLYSQ